MSATCSVGVRKGPSNRRDELTQNNGPGPIAKWFLRWLPAFIFMASWVASGLAAYQSVKIRLDLQAQRMVVIEETVKEHERRNAEERAELLYEIRAMREDVQNLMQRQAILLRDLK